MGSALGEAANRQGGRLPFDRRAQCAASHVQAVGERIGTGRIRVVRDVSELQKVEAGRRIGRKNYRSGLGS